MSKLIETRLNELEQSMAHKVMANIPEPGEDASDVEKQAYAIARAGHVASYPEAVEKARMCLSFVAQATAVTALPGEFVDGEFVEDPDVLQERLADIEAQAAEIQI